MANTQAMCTSFKGELLVGHHNFGTGVIRAATTVDTFKAALFLASATINAATTAYSTTGEVSSSGTNYTAGGNTVTNANPPATAGTTAYWTPSAAITYTNVTLTSAFDCVLIYNSTQSNKAVSVHTFGSQTVTAGTFTLTMPISDASTGLVRLA
jgi:hypothetical protein